MLCRIAHNHRNFAGTVKLGELLKHIEVSNLDQLSS